MYLSQLVEKRKMEEEEMLKMMEKEQEKRKKFREVSIVKPFHTNIITSVMILIGIN